MDRKHPAVVRGAPNAGMDKGSAQIASACPTFEPAAVQRNWTRRHQTDCRCCWLNEQPRSWGGYWRSLAHGFRSAKRARFLIFSLPPIVPAERPHHHKCIRNRLAWGLFAKEPDVCQRNGIGLFGWTERTCYS
jgi:hypothetical protein